MLLLEAAENAYPAIESTSVRCEQVKVYALRLTELKEKKKQLAAQMVALSVDRKEYKVFSSFPGIGDTTACRLIG